MRGVPSSKGSKVARCEKDLMMQAFVALIVRAGRLSSRGTTVRTGRRIVSPAQTAESVRNPLSQLD